MSRLLLILAATLSFVLAAAVRAAEPFDPFFNINDTDNLAEAERLLADGERGAA